MNTYKKIFNNNKIFYHGDRLKEYIEDGRTSSPVTLTIDLTNRCNNKCPHCISYLKDNQDIDYETLLRIFKDASGIGVKGIVITGGGEPLLYKKLNNVLRIGNTLGLHFGMITSGQDIGRSNEEWIEILSNLDWIRFSLDAGTPERYKRTHGLESDKFEEVISLINNLCDIKVDSKLDCTIGVAYLVNIDSEKKEKEDIDSMINLLSRKGLNYFQLRPVLERGEFNESYVDYNLKTKIYMSSEHPDIKLLNTSIMRTFEQEFSYCHGSHFISSIGANGKLYYCCIFKNFKNAEIADLNKERLKDVWRSDRIKKIGCNINLSKCPNRCKNNIINNILEEMIRDNNEHINFL